MIKVFGTIICPEAFAVKSRYGAHCQEVSRLFQPCQCDAANDGFLENHENENHRHDGDHCSCHRPLKVETVLTAQDGKAQGQSLEIRRVDDNGRNGPLCPFQPA